MKKIHITLTKLEKKPAQWAKSRKALMEFHINREVRREYGLKSSLFALTGNVILADMRQTRDLAAKFNAKQDPSRPERFIRAGQLYAMGLIDEILHFVVALYREQVQPDAFDSCLERLENKLGEGRTGGLLTAFSEQFPPRPVYTGKKVVPEYLESTEDGESCRALSLEETMLLSLANLNPAFKPFQFLFDDTDLATQTVYPAAIEEIKAHFKDLPAFGPDGLSLWDMLRAPALASPDSLSGQLEFMRRQWGLLLDKFMSRLLLGLDLITEEEKPGFLGPGASEVLSFAGLDEYERFSPDQDWMPKTVLMAKSTLVWLYQLSQKYGREISRLDQIPDEELDELSRRGFTGLWLIGLWERSNASRMVKQWTGNPEAAASAYSLYDYDIAGELGGWGALSNLRQRCMRRGIRLGSDMVPNHTGIDSRWVLEHPDRFLQLPYPPFPAYNYNCGNLSGRDDVTVQIEEHYFSRSDAAVVFKRIDNRTGETRYIYHGNDGTSMPWNDTAQIDFLNPEAREAVIRTIIGVCQQFSIVRFDAAMTLAKRHIQRLWYPAPGHGGAIASRAEHALSNEEFNSRIPNEFWREVVDRCASEAPHTLLLAEAFWMMEGYFVRTLGMHRVYNSAFMNMLKNEENDKYRATIKNTLEFDPEILKRFVNFMNNPDEDTAVAQFGKGDKYFGICALLVTMPGLPMFGHGQIEGFEEKYGMEYRRSYRDEQPDAYLVDRHEREIFPLMKRRALFSGSANFRIYDLYTEGGSVNENVFAYTNRAWINGCEERALVFFNNSYYETSGWIKASDPAIPQEGGGTRRDSISEALLIHGEEHYFTLLREQKSNLWYIRSSKETCEKGLFVSLKGYETQVYLDIHEVEDDAKGRWARLHHDLQGRGIPDPETAIMDIYLGELYYRFTEFLHPEFVVKLHELFIAGTGGKAKSGKGVKGFIDSLKAPAAAFFAAAAHYMGGADGKFDAWTPKKDGAALQFAPVEKAKIWGEFEAYINRLMDIAAYAGAGAKTPAERFLKNLALQIREHQAFCAAIFGYGVLSALRSLIGEGACGALAVSLGFDHWRLERKLKDQFRFFGASEDAVWRLAETSRAVLRRSAPENCAARRAAADKQFNAAGFAAALIRDNYSEGDFRCLAGINVFNDVTWFNKEAFEAALFYGTAFCALESDAAFKQAAKGKAAAKPSAAPAGKDLPWLERVARIAEIAEALTKAEAASGYRLDELIKALEGTGAEKPAAKKAAAEKGAKKAAVTKEKPAAKKAAAEKGAKKAALAKSDTMKKAVAGKPVAKKAAEKAKAATKSDTAKKAAKPAAAKLAAKAGAGKSTAKPVAKSDTVEKTAKPIGGENEKVARKTTAEKPVAKSATEEKAAKKPKAAENAVAGKPVAKKAAAEKAGAGKNTAKPVAKSDTVEKMAKPIGGENEKAVKKAAVTKPAAKAVTKAGAGKTAAAKKTAVKPAEKIATEKKSAKAAAQPKSGVTAKTAQAATGKSEEKAAVKVKPAVKPAAKPAAKKTVKPGAKNGTVKKTAAVKPASGKKSAKPPAKPKPAAKPKAVAKKTAKPAAVKPAAKNSGGKQGKK